jgi:hypothetical protein
MPTEGSRVSGPISGHPIVPAALQPSSISPHTCLRETETKSIGSSAQIRIFNPLVISRSKSRAFSVNRRTCLLETETKNFGSAGGIRTYNPSVDSRPIAFRFLHLTSVAPLQSAVEIYLGVLVGSVPISRAKAAACQPSSERKLWTMRCVVSNQPPHSPTNEEKPGSLFQRSPALVKRKWLISRSDKYASRRPSR